MSNLTKRVLAGIIGIPLITGAAYFGGIFFLIFSLLASSLALLEFFNMFEKKNFSPLKIFSIVLSGLIMISYLYNVNLFMISLGGILLIPFVEIFRNEKRDPLNPAIAIFGLFYITTPFIMLNLFLRSDSLSINPVIFLFILIWVCDTAAYFGGRSFGKHKLSAISPNKTWEGAASGFIFTIIISLLISFIFPDKISIPDALAIGIITGIFSQAGDLFESLIKRYCDVKDSSNIIPGHGGVLDRFDSLIFVTPFVFFYFMITGSL